MTLLPWILLLLAIVLQLVTLPTLIKRHNPDGQAWQGAVPGLHFFAWLKLIERPWYWGLFLLVPGINLIMLTVMHVELGLAFGRRALKDQWVMGALPWWGLWELRQGNDAWIGKRDWSKTRKSTAREWSEALIWATVVAGSLRMLIVEPFTIPTPSMEGSMLVGDYLVVSKTSYGPKLPRTPFTMPFVHNALPGGLTPSYTSWFSLPNLRLPGFRDVERYDAVVFSFPHGDTCTLTPTSLGTIITLCCAGKASDAPEAMSKRLPWTLRNTSTGLANKRCANPDCGRVPWTRWRTTSSDVSRFLAKQ